MQEHPGAPRPIQETPGKHSRAHRSTQEAPSSSQEPPSSSQEVPRMYPGAPRRHQGPPKRHQGDTQGTPKGHPAAARRYPECTPRRLLLLLEPQELTICYMVKIRRPLIGGPQGCEAYELTPFRTYILSCCMCNFQTTSPGRSASRQKSIVE